MPTIAAAWTRVSVVSRRSIQQLISVSDSPASSRATAPKMNLPTSSSRREIGATPSTQKRLPSSESSGKTKRAANVAIVSEVAVRLRKATIRCFAPTKKLKAVPWVEI